MQKIKVDAIKKPQKFKKYVWRLTQSDLIQLDYIEGYPDFYTRNRIAVELVNGMALKAWAYEVVQKETFVQPSKEYLNLIVGGARAFELPESYILQIEKFKV